MTISKHSLGGVKNTVEASVASVAWVSEAKPGLPSISANLSYDRNGYVVARSLLQQRDVKKLASAGIAFHENARSAPGIFSHRPVEMSFVHAGFASPALA
jgi:hypothetical protein